MSLNPYMFSSQRSQNALDVLQSHSSNPTGGDVQLDLTHLVSQSQNNDGHHHRANIMQTTNRMQQQPQIQQLSSGRQQQFSSSPVLPPQQLPKQSKKPKEAVLKTPLSLLNEICSKAKAIPVFQLEETGAVHSRVYTCTVKVDTQGFVCEASASGKTKKDAKQEAAKALLLQMDTQVEQFLLPKPPKEEPLTPVEVDPEVPGNPVGDLNDLCTKLKRLPPEYEDVAEFGKPHERVYTVACKLGAHLVESGRGRSKKSAKKVAAKRVHNRVMELLAKESGAALLKDDDNLIEKLSTLTLVTKQDAKKMADGWKLKDWLHDLRNRSGMKLDLLKETTPQSRHVTSDSMKLLKEIAEEQNFKLEFSELLDPGNKDAKICLIGVSTGNQPITVLMGTADSKNQARKSVAVNFIEMLRLIVSSK